MAGKKRRLKPLGDYVILTRTKAPDETPGGIVLPDTMSKEAPKHGIVLEVGPGTKDQEMYVKKGDTVIFGAYAGSDVDVLGEKFLVLKHKEILAILE